jgi:hypothetical protein
MLKIVIVISIYVPSPQTYRSYIVPSIYMQASCWSSVGIVGQRQDRCLSPSCACTGSCLGKRLRALCHIVLLCLLSIILQFPPFLIRFLLSVPLSSSVSNLHLLSSLPPAADHRPKSDTGPRPHSGACEDISEENFTSIFRVEQGEGNFASTQR